MINKQTQLLAAMILAMSATAILFYAIRSTPPVITLRSGGLAVDKESQLIYSMKESDTDYDLYYDTIHGDTPTKLLDSPKIDTHPSAHSDFVAFSRATNPLGTANLYLYNCVTNNTIQLTNRQSLDIASIFSQDGSTIYFARAQTRRQYSHGGETWDAFDIWSYSLATGKEERITNNSFFAINSICLLNNDTLLLGAESHAGFGVYQANLKNDAQPAGKPVAATPWIKSAMRTFDGYPFATTMGTVLFVSDRDGAYQYNIWNQSQERGQVIQITSGDNYFTHPVVMGDELVYLSDGNRNGVFQIRATRFQSLSNNSGDD